MKRSPHNEKKDGRRARREYKVIFTPEEKRRLQQAAKLAQKSLSAFVAEAGLRAAQRRLSPETDTRQP